MTKALGWWEYDPVTPAMVNTVTGERVVYRGALGGHMRVTWSESWLRYDYVHSELTFPLIARAIARDGSGKEPARTEHLSVDYSRSARLWRDDPFGNEVIGTAPAYGVWRRVDDCIVDAFACWPIDATGSWDGDSVEFLGGWLNGAWRPDFSRLCTAGHVPEGAASPAAEERSTSPLLMDLWAKPPSVWRVAKAPQKGSVNAASSPGKDGRERSTFLVTEDGQSQICAPAADDAVAADSAIFTLVQKNERRETPLVLDRTHHAGQRHLRLALSMLGGSDAGEHNHDWWRGSGWSVVDAFAAWQRDPEKPSDVEPPFLEWAPERLTVSGCFRGGLPIANARCDVFYAR